MGSWKDLARVLSKGDIKVKYLNLVGHGKAGVLSFNPNEYGKDELRFSLKGVLNPQNRQAVQAIKKFLTKDTVITLYSCDAGLDPRGLRLLAKELGIKKIRAFTGGTTPTATLAREGKWIDVFNPDYIDQSKKGK